MLYHTAKAGFVEKRLVEKEGEVGTLVFLRFAPEVFSRGNPAKTLQPVLSAFLAEGLLLLSIFQPFFLLYKGTNVNHKRGYITLAICYMIHTFTYEGAFALHFSVIRTYRRCFRSNRSTH